MIIEILFILALVLLVTEALNPTMGILGFAGFIAYIVGIWMLISSDATQFYGLSITNVIILGIIFFVAFGIFIVYLLRTRRKKVETGVESLIGRETKIKSWKNGMGKVFVDGEDWRAVGSDKIEIGDIVVITGYDKLTLTVEKK